MVCLECWYYHNIIQRIWYPIKAWILRKLIKYRADRILISGYVVAEIYDGPIEDGKLIKTFDGSNKWSSTGITQLINRGVIGTGSYYPGSMYLGDLCSDDSHSGLSTMAPLTNEQVLGTHPNKYYKAESYWGTSGSIADICQVSLEEINGGGFAAVYNFGSSFTKQDGQSLKITWQSTFSAV